MTAEREALLADATLALGALTKLGGAWRNDWSDFDGRTLRDQIYSWRTLMEKALRGELEEGEVERWLACERICPQCGSWEGSCWGHSDDA